jgi:regulator of sirC expression with transglutaminase-like and TPR domain
MTRLSGGSEEKFYRLLAALDSAATALKAEGIAALPADSAVSRLNRLVYTRWGLRFDADADNPDNLLPQRTLEKRSGGCLGVSLLFLMLGERLNLPLKGVRLPGHFFVRYHDGLVRINIEPNRSGVCHPDSYYRARYGASERSFYDLESLDARGAGATLAYGLGACRLKAGRWPEARRLFQRALSLSPGYPDALGNLALTWAFEGEYDSALCALERAERAAPGDPRVSLNRAAIHKRMGRK